MVPVTCVSIPYQGALNVPCLFRSSTVVKNHVERLHKSVNTRALCPSRHDAVQIGGGGRVTAKFASTPEGKQQPSWLRPCQSCLHSTETKFYAAVMIPSLQSGPNLGPEQEMHRSYGTFFPSCQWKVGVKAMGWHVKTGPPSENDGFVAPLRWWSHGNVCLSVHTHPVTVG